MSHYKYLGITIDQSLSFTLHVQDLVKKLKLKLGFFFFFLESSPVYLLKQKKFLSVLDYGDILYMYSTSQCLHALETVFHGALRFITNLKSLTHHCLLYSLVGWFSFLIQRWMHWHIFIYKAVLGLLPPYLNTYILPRPAGTGSVFIDCP